MLTNELQGQVLLDDLGYRLVARSQMGRGHRRVQAIPRAYDRNMVSKMTIPPIQLYNFHKDVREFNAGTMLRPNFALPFQVEAKNIQQLAMEQSYPLDCATGRNCEFGPYGPDGMIQCRYCGAEPRFYERRDLDPTEYAVLTDDWDTADLSETAVGTHSVAAGGLTGPLDMVPTKVKTMRIPKTITVSGHSVDNFYVVTGSIQIDKATADTDPDNYQLMVMVLQAIKDLPEFRSLDIGKLTFEYRY
jgi:hypothetical protein